MRKGGVDLATVRAGYEALTQGYKIAKKVKSTFGKTKTKTKVKQENRWMTNAQDGIKYKNVKLSYKAAKRQKLTQTLSQVGRVYTYANGGFVSTVGVQNAGSILALSNFDLNLLHTALNEGTALTTVRSNELLNFIGSVDEIEFMNCAPTPVEFDIYVLIDKITSITTNDPGTIWQDGMNREQSDAAAPIEAFSDPWLRPTDVKAFNIAYWSKRHSCVLTPGQKCKFNYTFNRKRLLDTAYQQSYQQIRGITHKIFCVVRGTIVDASNDKLVTSNGQSISDAKLVFIRKQTLFGSILSTLPKVVKHIVGGGAPVSGGLPTALAAQYHIDEDTGEPENAATAGEFA